MAETETTNSSDSNRKTSRLDQHIGRKFEVKTHYFAATAEALTKQVPDLNKLKVHPKAAIKSDQILDCFSIRGGIKTSSRSTQALEKSF